MLQHLRRAGRMFCIESEAWHEELLPQPAVEWQRDFTPVHPYTASFQRIRDVYVNGQRRPDASYELVDDVMVRWRSGYEPHDLENLLLTCGTAGSALVADWQAVTDASVTFTVDGAAYACTGITFAGLADMNAVALALQTALRAAMDSSNAYVRWYSTYFKVYVVGTGEVSYLTAGTTGTDISGASWMNGLTGTGSLSPWLQCNVTLKPTFAADDLPDWFMERYAEPIVDGALWLLMATPGKPWTNPELAEFHRRRFKGGIGRAGSDTATGRTGVVDQMRA
jgi:hypothetical protein